MKKTMLFTVLAASMMMFIGCDDDYTTVSPAIKKAFNSRYPDATRVEWERKADYYVADFHIRGTEAEAWYTPDAIWHMTETDIVYAALPSAVRSAFESGEYSGWRIEDIDMLERIGVEDIYIIEVEKGETEADLYYSADGILIKVLFEGGNSQNYPPAPTPSSAEEFIDTNYPGARIVEKDIERGMIEIDIVHGGVAKELLFSMEGEWISTKTDVRLSDVPEVVRQALAGSQYGSWRVDDVEHYDTPTVDFYRFELESGEREVKLNIDTAGNILQ